MLRASGWRKVQFASLGYETKQDSDLIDGNWSTQSDAYRYDVESAELRSIVWEDYDVRFVHVRIIDIGKDVTYSSFLATSV